MKTDYKGLYYLYCEDLCDCTNKKNVKKHNAAMKKLGNLYQLVKTEADKSFYIELLNSNNDRTRLIVAAHCIGLGVYVSKAKKVLLSLADCNNPMIAFEARATLDVWKKQGYLEF